LPIVIIYFEIVLYNLFFGFLIFLLILFFLFVLDIFIRAISFFNFGLSDSLFGLYKDGCQTGDKYPFGFFDGMKYKTFILFFPTFFVSSLLVPFVRGYDIWNFNFQLYLLVGLICFFSFGTYLLWKFGLHFYEALG
jgi:hypothetical protein